MRQFSVRNERGIALVIAIVALVVIGAIVAGTFFISTLEQRTSFNTVQTTQAFEAAEAGLQEATANWDVSWNTMAPGASTSWSTTTSLGGSAASYRYTVKNLNDQIFLLTSEGSKDGATQTLASLIRLVTTPVNVGAAVTSGGNSQVGGNAAIDGRDTIPAGWTRSPACPHSPDMAGIRSSGTIGTNGTPAIYGTPAKVEHDAGVTTDLFQSPFQQLKQQATLSFAGGNGQGNYVTFPTTAPTTTGSPAKCNRTDVNNWGEPLRSGTYVPECTSYAPVVYINGNAKFISAGRGQGILLVEGDLSIAGGFQWVGLVIATGEVKTGNGTSNVTGAILAQNADIGDQTSFSGTPVVSYSKCALDYVMHLSALGRPVAGRSWAQVF
jgi:Tfp pilus assembly protein PilX